MKLGFHRGSLILSLREGEKREDRGESCVELWIEKFSGDLVMLSTNNSHFLICS